MLVGHPKKRIIFSNENKHGFFTTILYGLRYIKSAKEKIWTIETIKFYYFAIHTQY